MFGKAAGFAPSSISRALDGTNGFRLDGDRCGRLERLSVASAGDVNGDGFDDLIIGAHRRRPDGDLIPARAMWYSARRAGFASTLDLAAPRRDQRLPPDRHASCDDYNSGLFGRLGGDVNGDGFDDLIVGAPGADSWQPTMPARAMWCSARRGGFAAEHSISRASTARTASGWMASEAMTSGNSVSRPGT